MKTTSCLTVLLTLSLWATNTAPTLAPAKISHVREAIGTVSPQESGINAQPKCGDYTLSRREAELLDKYQLDCPIKIPTGTEWYMKPVINSFLTEYVSMYQAEILAGSQFVNNVSMLGIRLLSQEEVKIYLEASGLSSLQWKIETTEIKNRVFNKLNPFFDGGFLVEIIPYSPSAMGSAAAEKLKPEFLDGQFVNFKKVWLSVLPAVETIPGLRINPATEKSEDDSISIKTFPRNVPPDGPGFVVIEEVTVSMSLKDRDAVRLSIISDVCRRRRSARNCYPIQFKGSADVRSDGLVSSPFSEVPVVEAIMKAIKR